MATDIVIYLILLIVTLGFGLLSYADRLFGILGVFTGFLGGLYMENNGGQIFTAQVYNTNSGAWIFSIIPSSEFNELIILLGVITMIDVVILILRSR